MHPIKPFDFQRKALPIVANLLKEHKSVLLVSPGGSGKTVIISAYTQLKIHVNPNAKVAIFVHREELAGQTREKLSLEILYDQLHLMGLHSQTIDADTTSVNHSVNVYVIMVETFNRRAESSTFLENFKDVSLYFCDEAHRTDFNKIFKYFEGVDRIGVTATPISGSKKLPLNESYKVMYEVATVELLQELNQENPKVGVVPSDLYCLGNVDRNNYRVKGNEFDEKQVSGDFSKKEQIDNTIKAYFELGENRKFLCFDVDVAHSKKMSEAFRLHGVPTRHVNGKPSDKFGKKEWRKESLLWLKEEPRAVLNNVGILTTGFDEPSVDGVLINSSMMSLSLYIQKMVRGSRPYLYPDGTWKKFYRALDMGNNAPETGGNMGDCNTNIDWQDYFDNPNRPNRKGVGGFKSCPNCGKLSGISATFCNGIMLDFLSEEMIDCGFIFPISEREEDVVPREMMKYFNTAIDMKQNIKFFVEQKGRTSGAVYFETLKQISNLAFKDMQFPEVLNEIQIKFLIDLAISKIKELGKISGRRTHKESVRNNLVSELRKTGFIVEDELIEKAIK